MASGSADWIFESIEAFLRSPLWGSPIMNFIEKNCDEFEDCEENKFIYTTIHNTYQELVDSLLEGFLADLGIDLQQFEAVVKDIDISKPHLQFLLEQILSASDFQLFKMMMVKTKLSMQAQAVAVGHRAPPQDAQPTEDTEEQFLAQALRESKAEYEARCQEASEEEAKAMQRVMEVSKEEYKKIKKDEDEMQRAIMLSLAEYSKELQRSNSSSDEAITREVTDQASKIPGDGADLSCSDATEQAPSRLLEQKLNLSADEIESARERHKQICESIREKKRALRSENLQNFSETVRAERPQTARAAEQAMSVEASAGTRTSNARQHTSRRLVEALKREVINKSDQL